MSFFRLLSLVLCLALLSVFAPAETSAALKSDATAKQKVQAENRKASVDEKLSELEKKLSAREAENEAAENDLKKADQSISEANRRLRTLKTERSTVEQRLSELRQDGRSVERDLREARSRYEQIMRAQYVHAQRHSWQSLIEGGNPNELARTAAELRYLSLAQQEAAKALTQKQTQIDTVEKETRARRAELSRIAREEEENHAKLLDEKRDRQAAVKKLAREIATQQAAIEKLKKTRLDWKISSLQSTNDSNASAQQKKLPLAQKRPNARRLPKRIKSPLLRCLLALLHNQRDVLSARYRVESLLASAVVVQDQPFGKVFFLVLQKVPKFLPVRLDELYFRTGFAATATCSSLIMAAPTCLSTQTTNLS